MHLFLFITFIGSHVLCKKGGGKCNKQINRNLPFKIIKIIISHIEMGAAIPTRGESTKLYPENVFPGGMVEKLEQNESELAV